MENRKRFFEVEVGRSSEDIGLTDAFRVTEDGWIDRKICEALGRMPVNR